jgi:hypothetical protein
MGQQVVFNYPMLSSKVTTTLLTPNSYPMGHHSHSIVSKNSQKWFKTGFVNTYLHNFLFYIQVCSMDQQVVFNYPMLSPKVPTTLMTPFSYPLGYYCHSFLTKNGQKLLKNMFLAMFTSITSYSTYKYVLWAYEWCQIML